MHWTEWLRTTAGCRGDFYAAKVNSIFDPNNSGHVNAAIGSPKFTAVLGPFDKTELFSAPAWHAQQRRARRHHHRDAGRPDCRSVRAVVADRLSPLLVPTKGAEVGVRTKIVPGLDSSVSLFILDQASELLFSAAMPATPRRAGRAAAMASNGPTPIGLFLA